MAEVYTVRQLGCKPRSMSGKCGPDSPECLTATDCVCDGTATIEGAIKAPVTLRQRCEVVSAPGVAVTSLSFRLLKHCCGRGEPLITPEILAGDEILAAAKLGQAPNRPR